MSDLLLATAGEDVRLWSMPDLNLHSVKSTPGNSVKFCTCSNNGQMLAYANEGHLGIHISSLLSENTTIWEIPTVCEQSNVAFSNSSRFVVSGGKDCVVNVWDIKSRSVRRTFRDQINPISFCVFNFNDKIVASSSDKGEIILTDVSSGLASDPLLGVDTETINCLQYSHFTHNLLASAGSSGAVTLWDTLEKKLLRTFTEHNSSSTCLSFSPLNDMLLSSTGLDKRIIFYDVCYKKIVKTINTEEPLTCCDFLHDGTTVAVGAASGHIFLFDLRHGATPLKVIPAHRTPVRSVSFQKLSKEKSSKRQLPQETKVERSVSSVSSLKQQESIETSMEMSLTSQVPAKISRNSQVFDLTPTEEMDNFPMHEDSWRLSSGKSLENLQSTQAKYAKLSNDYSSSIEFDSSRKPLKRSKSSLKKYDLSPKSSIGDSDTQLSNMGSRNKSGLSRLSLLSRSTGDISKSGKKKEKESDDISNIIKRSKDAQKEANEAKKGLFKTPFRKKVTDYKPSDDSETSSMESISIDDKIYMRGKKNRSSIHSNDSDSKSCDFKIPETSYSKSITDHKQTISDTQDTVELTEAKPTSNTASTNDLNMASSSSSSSTNSEKSQIDIVQKLIDEAMEDTRIAVHRDMVNMQVEFIRQMEIQKEQIRQMLEHYSINDDLVSEIQRLRTENDMLKRKY